MRRLLLLVVASAAALRLRSSPLQREFDRYAQRFGNEADHPSPVSALYKIARDACDYNASAPDNVRLIDVEVIASAAASANSGVAPRRAEARRARPRR